MWRSLVARSVRVGEVPSSNLGTPIASEPEPTPDAGSGSVVIRKRYVASALALSWSYSAWVIAPDARSSLPLAISSVGEPDAATERT